jgi:hypothetical protein
VHQYFGIAFGLETMTLGEKLRANFLEVVNLTIKNNPYCAVLIAERLSAALYIDDAKSNMSKGHVSVKEKPFVVRTSMMLDASHPFDYVPARFFDIEVYYASNATHIYFVTPGFLNVTITCGTQVISTHIIMYPPDSFYDRPMLFLAL